MKRVWDNDFWVAEELVERLVDNMDFILDRAVAVNDAGYIICSGHADDGPDDTWNTHRFLLTPLSFPAPAVTTLPSANITSSRATLRAKVNAGNLATTGVFQHGMSTGYGTTTPIAPISGMLPSLAERTLTGLNPHTTYHYRATATNSTGTTDGTDESFTTAWDWTSWATVHLGSTDPASDSNDNGQPDAIDYATGNEPAMMDTVEDGQMKFTFRRLLTADGITITVQVSDDLITWIDGSSYSLSTTTANTAVTTEISRIPDGPETEWITIGIDASRPIRFVRLKTVMP